MLGLMQRGRFRHAAILGLGASVGLVFAACGGPDPGDGGPDPTPTPGPGDDELTYECISTDIGPIGPYSAKQGGPLPIGFDQANSGTCTFSEEVEVVSLVLLQDGDVALERHVELDEPSEEIGLPFDEGAAGDVPEDFETGEYRYELQATGVSGETVTFHERDFWVFDAAGTPEELARADLAERLGVDESDLGLMDYSYQEWPDAALGCPQPGEEYAQVVTPGFLVILTYDNERYAYHTTEAPSEVRLCEDEEQGHGEGAPVDIVKDDLAEKLGVDADEIEVKEAVAKEWPDTSLGCPEPGQSYAQVITPGYKVVLTHDGEEHTYHTDEDGSVVKLCDEPNADDSM